MCGLCTKDVEPTEAWMQIQVFVDVEPDLDFSEPICPECVRTLVPEIFLKAASGCST